jgi:hypothetical protein
MLSTRWKGSNVAGPPAADAASEREMLKAGQIRSFKISKLDAEKKKIDLELIS